MAAPASRPAPPRRPTSTSMAKRDREHPHEVELEPGRGAGGGHEDRRHDDAERQVDGVAVERLGDQRLAPAGEPEPDRGRGVGQAGHRRQDQQADERPRHAVASGQEHRRVDHADASDDDHGQGRELAHGDSRPRPAIARTGSRGPAGRAAAVGRGTCPVRAAPGRAPCRRRAARRATQARQPPEQHAGGHGGRKQGERALDERAPPGRAGRGRRAARSLRPSRRC